MSDKNYKSGVYQILNIVNNKRYIGSASNLKKRLQGHKNELKKNNHINRYLQNSYNKYGVENFKFEILLYCSKEDLLFYEQRAIDAYNKKDIYNVCLIAGNCLGVPCSDEKKQKLKEIWENMSVEKKEKHRTSCLGRTHSEERKIKASISRKGKKASLETIEKLRQSHIGYVMPEEQKQKISESNKGRKRSKESILKTSKANKGKKRTPEFRLMISEMKKGTIHSSETKEKMSKAHKGEKAPHYGKLGEKNHLAVLIYQIDLTSKEIIKKWGSAIDIERELKIDSSAIIKVCRNKRNKAGGFGWVYVKDYENKIKK